MKFQRISKVITNYLGSGHTAVFDQSGQQINELQYKEADDPEGWRLVRLREFWADEHTIFIAGNQDDARDAFRHAFPNLN